MSRRVGAAVLASFALTSVAWAERPRSVLLDVPVESIELPPTGAIPYNTVFLNRCPNGCTINGSGYSNSITDQWGLGGGTRTLTSFPYGDEAWNNVVACVRDVFSPFQVNIVTQSPGSANHFEIMIAGRGTDLGGSAWSSYGGVAPGNNECNSYVNNALVFAFAKAYGDNNTNTCDSACVNEICATAAQEIGHVWRSMDHVVVPADPMTYFGFAGRRYFQNMNAQCGSDCVGGQSPDGETCTGTNSQIHSCRCTGDTQNSYEILKSMFGLGPGTPPTVTITSPKLGEAVDQGFNVFSEVSDDSMIISRVEFKVDGQTVTTINKGPFVFGAPSGLADGTHRVEVIAYDGHQTPKTATVDVVIGPPCDDNDDCTNRQGDVCLGGRCVVGPSVNGGLGTSCTNSDQCASQSCASDGTESFCVELCLVGQCPDGFGCLETDGEDNSGVCWPGYDDGSGGCGCQSTRGGPVGMLLAFMVMVLTCRRRRR